MNTIQLKLVAAENVNVATHFDKGIFDPHRFHPFSKNQVFRKIDLDPLSN